MRLLEDSLESDVAQPDEAGFRFGVEAADEGFHVGLSGFPEKLLPFVSMVVARVRARRQAGGRAGMSRRAGARARRQAGTQAGGRARAGARAGGRAGGRARAGQGQGGFWWVLVG